MFIKTTKKGERVIVDPIMTTSRIYMVCTVSVFVNAAFCLCFAQYFYFFINIGSLIGQIGMTYSEKFVGYWLAYLLPTILFCVCPLVLFIGRNRYERSPPTGSVLATSLRIWRQAAKGRWSWNPARMWRNFEADDFWEGAKPSNWKGESRPKWMNFDDQWVDEVSRGFKACAVFMWYPVYCESISCFYRKLLSYIGLQG